MSKLRQRLQREEGFTLIELLVVIVIIGILLAIAIPSYLHFKDQAHETAAASDIRAAFPAAESYYAEHLTYTGMDLPNTEPAGALAGIDAGVKLNKVTVAADGKSYTLCAISGDHVAVGAGPAHTINVLPPATTACP